MELSPSQIEEVIQEIKTNQIRIDRQKVLGRGREGKVYEAATRKNLQIAVKKILIDEDMLLKLQNEARLAESLTLLSHAKVSRGFQTLWFSSTPVFACETGHEDPAKRVKTYEVLIYQERASGDLLHFWKHEVPLLRTPDDFDLTVLSLLFQMYQSILTMTYYLDIVHNDLYPRNILYYETKKIALQYAIEIPPFLCAEPMQFTWPIFMATKSRPTSGFVFKMIDLGFASCSLAPDCISHDNLVAENFHSVDLHDKKDFSEHHVTEFRNIEPYCRDIISFTYNLSELCHATHFKTTLTAYIDQLLDMLLFGYNEDTGDFLDQNSIEQDISLANIPPSITDSVELYTFIVLTLQPKILAHVCPAWGRLSQKYYEEKLQRPNHIILF